MQLDKIKQSWYNILIKNVCKSLFLFANQLSKLAYQNLRLRKNEELLNRLNHELEQRVEERTAELFQSNQYLSSAMKALWGEMELAKKIQTVLNRKYRDMRLPPVASLTKKSAVIIMT